jgi:hypothetical protein
MVKTDLRPAYYALSTGAWRDSFTLLHLPYTAWHLSYVLLGAAAAPTIHLERVAGLLLAFFLAVGLGAHALDEFQGRPLRTQISDGWLLAIAGLSMAGALGIGVVASLTISLWVLPFVFFGAFIVPAYNLELWRGRFHSDLWFGLAWGAFPALAGYWGNAQRLEIQALMIAAACFALSMAQRTLSNRARGLRRNALSASGFIEFRDGTVEAITIPYLLAVPETTLRMGGLAVTLLALGWLVARL